MASRLMGLLFHRGERLSGAITAIQGNARRLGGSFAHWGGLFSVFDCTFAYMRGVEDPYNSIMSGFFTGATLAIRGGVRHTPQNQLYYGNCVAQVLLRALIVRVHEPMLYIPCRIRY
jgi:import inner membrane translocase subunit TIM17